MRQENPNAWSKVIEMQLSRPLLLILNKRFGQDSGTMALTKIRMRRPLVIVIILAKLSNQQWMDPDLLFEIHTCDEGWVITALGANDCGDTTVKSSMSAVELENVECEKNGDYRLSPGSAIVGRYEVYRSCKRPESSEVVSLSPLLVSAGSNEFQEDNETGNGLHYPSDNVGGIGDGARLDHPAPVTMDKKESEEVQHDNKEVKSSKVKLDRA